MSPRALRGFALTAAFCAGFAAPATAQKAQIEVVPGRGVVPQLNVTMPVVRGGGGSPAARLVLGNAERLGLSDEQRASIAKISATMRKERRQSREKVRAAQEELAKMMAEELPDEGAVMKQAEVVSALTLDDRKASLGQRIEIVRVLTPEQRSELHTIRGEASAPKARPKGQGRGKAAPAE